MKNFRRYISVALSLAVFVLIGCIVFAPGALSGANTPEMLGKALGIRSLLPTMLAVALAFVTKNVVLSLLIGYLAGTAMVQAVNGGTLASLMTDTFTSSCNGILTTVTDPDKAPVLILCFVVGGLVEVIRKSGGFDALARKLASRINTPKKACLMTQLISCCIFFDDYANALIVGPVMRALTDRVGVSPEKLSFLVDSNAAPLTGIAIISSWVAVEVSVINEGLIMAGLPETGYSLFLQSIPYCFYCLFCLVFLFFCSLTGREYGPMLTYETRARQAHIDKSAVTAETENSVDNGKDGVRMFIAIGSLVFLILMAVVGFYVTGREAAVAAGQLAPDAPFTFSSITTAFAQADTIFLVMQAAIASSAIALLLGSMFKLFTIEEGLQTWIEGATSMMPTVLVLALAWPLASTVSELGTVYYVVDFISASVPWWLVPTLIFLACCVVSFATGSYGCMFIVMPMAIPIAVSMPQASAAPDAHIFMLACIGAVLGGSIFGDHASPVTDCTILSALGSGCNTMDHVKTQLPYAITVATISIAFGTLLSMAGLPVWICLALGFGALLIPLFVFGKVPEGTRNKS